MKWKCINDLFGYCSGEPDGADKARTEERLTKVNGIDTIVKISLGMGATCLLNPKTCGKRQSFETVCPPSIVNKPVKQETPEIPVMVTKSKKMKIKKEKQETLSL